MDVSERRSVPESRFAPEETSTGKPMSNKKSSKKSSDKKTAGKHSGRSDSSQILGGIV
jgi:hypothetical protein